MLKSKKMYNKIRYISFNGMLLFLPTTQIVANDHH